MQKLAGQPGRSNKPRFRLMKVLHDVQYRRLQRRLDATDRGMELNRRRAEELAELRSWAKFNRHVYASDPSRCGRPACKALKSTAFQAGLSFFGGSMLRMSGFGLVLMSVDPENLMKPGVVLGFMALVTFHSISLSSRQAELCTDAFLDAIESRLVLRHEALENHHNYLLRRLWHSSQK